MELRRALLLFVVVLGIAAVVTVINGPRDPGDGAEEPAAIVPVTPQTTPRAEPGPPDPGDRAVRFDATRAPRTRSVPVHRALTVTVSVDEPGEATIEGLGLTQAAEPDDPASFDVLPANPGRYRVEVMPAGERTSHLAGILRVGSAD